MRKEIVDGHPGQLDGVVFRKELAKMRIRVLPEMSTELIPLHEGDEHGVELEIVNLYHWANNRGGDA